MRGIANALIGAALLAMLAGCGADSPREANFKQISKAKKAIDDELKKSAPAIDAIRANAKLIGTLAPQVPSWFPAGSGTGTEALPAIWEKPAEFSKAAADFAAASHALQAAATAGEVARITAAATDVGGTCKACHSKFREKK